MPVSASPTPSLADLQAQTSSLAGQVAAKADASAIPQPATSAPPAVADSGAQGSITRYAMENHTLHMLALEP